MTSKLKRANLVVIALAVLMASFAPAAYADKCSTKTVAGDWALTLTGTIVPGGVAVGAIARGTWDESGNITNGTEARNVGGGYADETVRGNWTVNPDCTGTLNVDIYESGALVRVSVVSITFDDDSAELRGVQKSLTLPDGTNVPVVITLEGRRQEQPNNQTNYFVKNLDTLEDTSTVAKCISNASPVLADTRSGDRDADSSPQYSPGWCAVNPTTDRLTGLCLGKFLGPSCQWRTDPKQCPQGALAKGKGAFLCGKYNFAVDYARPCS